MPLSLLASLGNPSHYLGVNIGVAGLVLYLVVAAVAFGFFGRSLASRFRLLQVGAPAARFDRIGERIQGTLKFAIAQARMPEYPLVGIIHMTIFWGFGLIVLTNLTLLLQGILGGDFHLPLLGHDALIGRGYRAMLDFFEVAILIGALIALFNRAVLRPSRLTFSGEAMLILGIIATMMTADLIYEASGLLLVGKNESSGFGANIAIGLLQGSAKGTLEAIWGLSWWVHVGLILIFANILPYSKHFHVITAIPNVFFRDLDGPKALSTPKIDMETGEVAIETYGKARIIDFSWKDNLDFYTCTECGRCSDNCPANLSGKPLSPKYLTVALRDNLYHNDAALKSMPKPTKPEKLDEYDPSTIQNTLSPLVIEEEVLWSCTTCRACEVACPVFISYVDKIVDMRRRLVSVDQRMPKELQKTYENMERQSNPWGINAQKRGDWADGLEIKTMAEVGEAEYLYFVGCAASFDDRMKKIAQAVVKIFNAAKVDFAILGAEESCTGDTARRSGNEFLFQTLAGMNVAAFQQYKFKKIVTHCPHCFNTLKNEYPALGASYEVVHHSELIDKLLREGKLTPQGGKQMRVVFHDSCYLGRYNEVYEAPRDIVRQTGATVVDPPRARKQGLCCGAGGARMWMEEKIGTRMNHERTDLLLSTKPDAIAVACPFCMTMISDGVKDREANVPVLEISELVAAALGEPAKEAAE